MFLPRGIVYKGPTILMILAINDSDLLADRSRMPYIPIIITIIRVFLLIAKNHTHEIYI